MDATAVLRAKLDFHKTITLLSFIVAITAGFGATLFWGNNGAAFYSLIGIAVLFFIGFVTALVHYVDRHVQLMEELFRQ